MNVETLQTNPNLDALKQQLVFASPEGIAALRTEQARAMDEATVSALSKADYLEAYQHGSEIEEKAHKEAAAHFDDELERRLDATLNRADQPELFEAFLNHLKKYSAHRMSHTEWVLGEPDKNGDYHNADSQGYVRAQSDFDQLCEELLATQQAEGYTSQREPGPNDPELPPDSPEQTELDQAQSQLEGARVRLAELSVRRRQMIRKGGKRAEALREEFEVAEEAYKAASLQFGTLKARQQRALGKADAELRTSVMHYILDEHQAFTRAEAAVLEQDDSRRGRMYRFLARKHNLLFASAVGGFGIGLLSRKFITGALGMVIGISGPMALAAGAAVKSTRAVLMATIGRRVNQIRMLDMRATADRLHLQNEALPAAMMDITDTDEMVQASYAQLRKRISERIEADRKYNRNRVIQAVVVSGALAAGGVIVADHFLGNHQPTTHGQGSGTTPEPGPGHSPSPAPQTPLPAPEAPNPNLVDGYNPNITVEQGHGYTNELQDLIAQKNEPLSGAQAWRMYLDMVHHFPNLHGNFFINDPSYAIGKVGTTTNFGISYPGTNIHWRPEVIDYVNQWYENNVK